MSENTGYLDRLYADWQRDPHSVPPAWRAYFEEQEPAAAGSPPAEAPPPAPSAEAPSQQLLAQSRVNSLLWAYRDIGYLYSNLNPLGDQRTDHSYLPGESAHPYQRLTLEEFGIPERELDVVFAAGGAMQPSRAPLREILEAFRQTYCSSIGVEFLHIQNKDIRRWLIQSMESTRNRPDLGDGQKRAIFNDLLCTEEMERFLDTHFAGQKRFSLAGGEVLIPALHTLVDRTQGFGIEDVVIGTAHRGRLSILTTLLNMPPQELFSRFEDNYGPGMFGGSGDVKYHIGYDTDHIHDDGSRVHIVLLPNPSHLEAVDGVMQGRTRAAQDRKWDAGGRTVLPVLIHGDAAFCGQGVVAETLNLSQLPGYSTGGTIHIIINNQIGFTTPGRSARSTFFPTDVAKMLPVPIFHVNGDDPEAVVHVMGLALNFRQTFALDCVVDIFCYRRHGHNEGDEPSFTHPHMYRLIRAHPSVGALYSEACERQGILSRAEQDALRQECRASLKAALEKARAEPSVRTTAVQDPEWGAIAAVYDPTPVATGVTEATLRRIAGVLTAVPDGFRIHPKLLQILNAKEQALREKGQVDWAFAESLAFGSLLLEGVPVRLSGQDCERGTFSQRHLRWWDVESASPKPYTPLRCLGPDQAPFRAYDSPLSEYSVLGFEYGYSLGHPRRLTIWEAQFGDFSNGAQVVIDNFIAGGESKWGVKSGLVLLLPHGYEGQGPDHSNAHLERFLQLCAQDNLQVCNATTPAQYFHLLRRQVHAAFRKPLVVMTPKSLLRHPQAVSDLGSLVAGSFAPVLEDPLPPASARRILLCSGKVYYDLVAQREKAAAKDVAIVRLEQFYPFPAQAIRDALARHGSSAELAWVQEEPQNFGAWQFIRQHFDALGLGRPLAYCGRPPSPSTAVGRLKLHRAEQQQLLENAFAPLK